MGCQTTYCPPIVIPTGTKGDPEAAGGNGSNGVAIYINTTGTNYSSTGTGLQTLLTTSLAGNLLAAGDIVDIEGIFSITPTADGIISITFGNSTITFYQNYGALIMKPEPLHDTLSYVSLRARIYIKTTTTQSYTREVEIMGKPSMIVKSILASATVDTTVAIPILAISNLTIGSSVLRSLVLTISKKV